jgi:hypothetical protein
VFVEGRHALEGTIRGTISDDPPASQFPLSAGRSFAGNRDRFDSGQAHQV